MTQRKEVGADGWGGWQGWGGRRSGGELSTLVGRLWLERVRVAGGLQMLARLGGGLGAQGVDAGGTGKDDGGGGGGGERVLVEVVATVGAVWRLRWQCR